MISPGRGSRLVHLLTSSGVLVVNDLLIVFVRGLATVPGILSGNLIVSGSDDYVVANGVDGGGDALDPRVEEALRWIVRDGGEGRAADIGFEERFAQSCVEVRSRVFEAREVVRLGSDVVAAVEEEKHPEDRRAYPFSRQDSLALPKGQARSPNIAGSGQADLS